MARPARRRVMPRTPQDRPPAPPLPAASATPVAHPSVPPRPAPRPVAAEPAHLIAGTRCEAGHAPGQELEAGRLGTVPSRRRTRIGFGVVLWCVAGVALLAVSGIIEPRLATFAAQLAGLWLVLVAVLVRSAGHRRRCWRTRTWRHAWGGFAPGPGA